ncbi:MAG: phosphodiester glycosidase family protein [Solirubrobacteraceae bacterium]|nr:phosphodiester glycosidase family protein [Solirubrobacteraceae bacterium]
MSPSTFSPPPPRRATALLASMLAFAALPAAALTLPSVARGADAPALSLLDAKEQVGPGIAWERSKTLSVGGWADAQFLTVDLANPAVTTDELSGKVTSAGPLTEHADDVGAVAGVNGDFFDIGNSSAPLGGVIQGGKLKKSPNGGTGWNHAGVGKDGLGRLVDLALEASATFGGAAHTVSGLNVASAGVANPLLAYTPAWGTYSRSHAIAGSTDKAEALVRDGKVVSVDSANAGAGEIPEDGFYLVGSGTSAALVRSLSVGQDVTLAYGVKDEVAKSMQFAIGGNQYLIRDGVRVPDAQLETALHPRTAICFKDDGRTMVLGVIDGRQAVVPGISLRDLARLLEARGCQQAMNLDGGGSTTLVTRPLGEDRVAVRNTPSDGFERHDPNGVGIFVKPGNGKVEDLVVRATGNATSVFPGLHRSLTVRAVDSNQVAVKIGPGDVRWTSAQARTDGNLLEAPADQPHSTVQVRATNDGAQGALDLKVLGKLHALELNSTRFAFADTAVGASELKVTGRDAQGFTAPVQAEDLELEYDRTVVKVAPSGTALKVTPLKTGGTLLKVRVGGQLAQLPISVGVRTENIYEFDAEDEPARWIVNGTAGFAKTLTKAPEGLRLDYKAQRNMGVTKTPAETRIAVPGEPLRVRVRIWSDGPTEYRNMTWYDADGAAKSLLSPGVKAGWGEYEWTMPAGTKFPIKIGQLQVIETGVSRQRDGAVIFDRIEVDLASDVATPPTEPLRRDELISPDGRASAADDWSFATLSDIQFTAADPTLAKVGVAALERIRATNPDLVVLNGDITDLGAAEDLDVARATLEAGGCDLIEVGKEPDPASTPTPADGKVPCYFVPGNHESYRSNGQGTLDPFVEEFGRPYRTFDHKGTRFVLLNSSLGSLRGSSYGADPEAGFKQLLMFRDALDSARADASVRNVMVFAHHPVDDPDLKGSQLGERTEVQLIEKLLTDFRTASGKGAGMVGSHAQIVNVQREQGVPYVVHPSSGKAPYGVPDRGGFTGWIKWNVDRDADAFGQWITADVRAFAQSVALNVPGTTDPAAAGAMEVGTTVPLSGSIVQPSGVQPGSRVVPLAYPMSVRWSGSPNLAIGSGAEVLAQARRSGKAAVLDPRTMALTALRQEAVTVRVTNDSMREFTDEASLAPVSAERTIAIGPWTGPGPRAVVSTPVFSVQPVGTVGEGQWVTVKNEGDQPLAIDTVAVQAADDASSGVFLLSDDACSVRTIEPGASCRVLVRFAPRTAKSTSVAQLVLQTNTADRVHVVALSATSGELPKGDAGATGPKGDAGATGPKGDAGTNGTDGAIGPVGTAGPQGTKGETGVGVAGPQGQPGPAGPIGQPGPQGPAAPIGTAVVDVRCELSASSRAVVCTIRQPRGAGDGAAERLRVKGQLVGSRTSVVKRGTRRVTVTLRGQRKLSTRSRVKVELTVGKVRQTMTVKVRR